MELWSDGARVVTLRHEPLQTPRHVLRELDAGRGPVDAGKLISELIEVMIARMSRAIVTLNDHIDALEDADMGGDP
jgi:zinc transporter